MQHFTPLILSNSDDPQLLPHLNEPDSPERFCQDVCQLFISAYMLNINHTICYTLPDVVIASVYMLGSLMVYRIFAKLLSRSAINVKSELFHFSLS